MMPPATEVAPHGYGKRYGDISGRTEFANPSLTVQGWLNI